MVCVNPAPTKLCKLALPVDVIRECDATHGGFECDNVHGGQSQCLQLFHCLPHHRLTAWAGHLNAAQVYQLANCASGKDVHFKFSPFFSVLE